MKAILSMMLLDAVMASRSPHVFEMGPNGYHEVYGSRAKADIRKEYKEISELKKLFNAPLLPTANDMEKGHVYELNAKDGSFHEVFGDKKKNDIKEEIKVEKQFENVERKTMDTMFGLFASALAGGDKANASVPKAQVSVGQTNDADHRRRMKNNADDEVIAVDAIENETEEEMKHKSWSELFGPFASLLQPKLLKSTNDRAEASGERVVSNVAESVTSLDDGIMTIREEVMTKNEDGTWNVNDVEVYKNGNWTQRNATSREVEEMREEAGMIHSLFGAMSSLFTPMLERNFPRKGLRGSESAPTKNSGAKSKSIPVVVES